MKFPYRFEITLNMKTLIFNKLSVSKLYELYELYEYESFESILCSSLEINGGFELSLSPVLKEFIPFIITPRLTSSLTNT